ncbi:MAG: helix-turn-helix transcriptional regulator [Burkholderiales bacterium]|nr:helix-turn-helix transcriptional regulator [Burkholderiales bacterium]
MIPSLTSLILSLYRGSRDIPATAFQDWALKQTRQILAFESAIWGRAGIENGMAQIYSVHLHRLPPESLASYARFRDRDTVGAMAMQAMGTTIRAAGHEVLANDPEMLEQHVRRFGLDYSLTTCIVDPRTGLISFMTLFRPAQQPHFTEDERVAAQSVVPHLIESCQQSRLMQLNAGGIANSNSERRFAVCDADFVLIAARDGFAELLRGEWPDWNAPRLPEAARTKMQGAVRGSHAGDRIMLSFDRVSDLYWLSARTKTAIDTLGKRQLEIARLSAQGQTYKQIAATLELAPATVRNHLDAVYRKLGIGSRGELATLVSRLD